MFLVGLTGGIATGKSTVAAMFRSKGIEIIDSDVIAREVVEPRKRAWKKIRKEFGESVFHEDGTINRPVLGQIIFSHPEKRQLLNSITHPEVYKSIYRKCIKLFFRGHQFAIIDVPLLFENGKMVKYIHRSIVVTCDPVQQLERLKSRDNLSESDALARINAQMPLAQKTLLADYVISNCGDQENTQKQVDEIFAELRSSKAHYKYRFLAAGCVLTTVTLLAVLPYLLYLHIQNRTSS